MKTKPEKIDGFTLTEVLISSAIFSVVSLGLLMGFTSLERSFSAATDFATKHSDEMRISDYLALDLRRAVRIQAAENDTKIFIPAYYDGSGSPQTPALDGKGGVTYGTSGTSVRVRYYLSGGTIFREEVAWPVALSSTYTSISVAENVKDFVFAVTDLGKVVTTKITFNPSFRSGGASATTTAATAFYNTTLLRNTRTDTSTGVY